jgi:hypothetical protein
MRPGFWAVLKRVGGTVEIVLKPVFFQMAPRQTCNIIGMKS